MAIQVGPGQPKQCTKCHRYAEDYDDVCHEHAQERHISALTEHAKALEDELIEVYKTVLGCEPEDKTYLHVSLHIKNAINNLHADKKMLEYELTELKKSKNK